MKISAHRFHGRITIPPSKSYAHRMIIAAALTDSTSIIRNIAYSEDIAATIRGMRSLGATFKRSDDGNPSRAVLTVTGLRKPIAKNIPVIDCHASGSTLRFLLPVALALYQRAVFTGSPQLARRSLAPYRDLFTEKKIIWKQRANQFPLRVEGNLKPGDFPITGRVSSQFISGLMFALPLLPAASQIRITDTLESAGYVAMTQDVLERFGVAIHSHGLSFSVDSGHYHQTDEQIEGDWSQAAFPLLMGMIGGRVAINGLSRNSRQGDRSIELLFRSMNGRIYWEGSSLIAEKSELTAIHADVSQCPDLAPAMVGAMALARGRSVISGGRRLRDKESDRIASVSHVLKTLGARVTETEDGMIIDGVPALHGGSVSSYNDHRIAMLAASLSAAVPDGCIRLEHAQTVAKSWPDFYRIFQMLGGRLDNEQQLGKTN